jgi:hypothetical protein
MSPPDRIGLSVLSRPEVPLFTGDLEAEAARMNRHLAEELGGKLSYPSKMDCPAWGIPARYCRVGSRLVGVEGSTCQGCYALKGTFRFKNVDGLLEDNYRKLFNVLWTPAVLALVRWEAKDRMRWLLSGDLQDESMARNIFAICRATRHLLHWLPTREGALIRRLRSEVPDNLTVRESATMVDGPPGSWPWTSTVVTEAANDACPSSTRGGNCGDHDCVACWDRAVQNVAYLKH